MLRPAKGNMYGFVTHTWNPVRGLCPHGCSYCYMNKIYKRFGKTPKKPYLDERELRTNLGSGNVIFVCSSIDLFANDIPCNYIDRVIAYTKEYPNNTYLWHTKNVLRAEGEQLISPNNILCATMESDNIPPEILNNADDIYGRTINLMRHKGRKMITIEPIMKFRLDNFAFILKQCEPEQVNIGADSGSNRLPEPDKEETLALIAELEAFTKVYIKDNLRRIIG